MYDRNLERARATARRFRIPSCHDDVDAFLSSGLDIVSICTPPWTHGPLAMQALQRGCHVFTEKPMAMSVGEAEAMVDAARTAGRSLCVSHNFLFSRSMRRAERLIERGELGAVQHVIGLQLSSPRRRLPPWYPQLPGGLFFDESPHLLYLMRRFMGGLDIEYASTSRAESGEQPVSTVRAGLSGKSATGVLTMSFDAPVSEWVLLVVGSQRVLIFDIFRDILTVLRSDGAHSPPEVLASSLRFGLGLAKGFLTSGPLYATGRLLYGHEVLVRRFVDSVLEGTPPPVTGEDGLEVVRAMEAILRTAGHPLAMPASQQ